MKLNWTEILWYFLCMIGMGILLALIRAAELPSPPSPYLLREFWDGEKIILRWTPPRRNIRWEEIEIWNGSRKSP